MSKALTFYNPPLEMHFSAIPSLCLLYQSSSQPHLPIVLEMDKRIEGCDSDNCDVRAALR